MDYAALSDEALLDAIEDAEDRLALLEHELNKRNGAKGDKAFANTVWAPKPKGGEV